MNEGNHDSRYGANYEGELRRSKSATVEKSFEDNLLTYLLEK